MNRSWARVASKLQFHDAYNFLVNLRKLEIEVAMSDTPARTRSLRTNRLKQAREQRQAALFCEGLGKRIGQAVAFACLEDQDFDFIASHTGERGPCLAPVQLKEVVPTTLNAKANIASVVQGLEKYTDSSNLTVAIHLNQVGRFEPDALNLQHLKLASVWVFAAVAVDQSVWNLWGNFTEAGPYGTEFHYPTDT